MPTVSSIDGSRWYRYRNHTRAIRSPSNSVSAWFIEKTHSRHVKKSQRSRLHARREGRRGQWTSVKAIYVNAETRILIYILCGSEFAIVIPGKIRWATAPNQRHFLSSAVPERLEMYNACSSFAIREAEGRETGTKRWLSRVFAENIGFTGYSTFQNRLTPAERPTSLTSRRDRFLHPWPWLRDRNKPAPVLFQSSGEPTLFANRTELETNV